MANFVGFETSFKVTGPDGTVLWTGAGKMGVLLDVFNGDATAIGIGEAVVFDVTASRIPRWDVAASGTAIPEVLSGKRVFNTGALNKGYLGVAAGPIAVGATGPVLGAGSICCVKSLTAASLTNNVLGAYVIDSTTQGAVNASNTLPTVPIGYLGKVLKLAGATGGATDSGSLTQLGILVMPN